jgi:hypothetical protein
VDTLLAAGIELFTGEQGTIRDVLKKYATGNLKPSNKPTVDSHFGMGAGTGIGRGSGVRRGMGGRGGMGRSFNTSGNRSVKDKEENSTSGNQELENLKEQAERLNQQMKSILTRINNLEKL